MSLIAELKRRNVFRVSVAYLALGWIVTQVTSTVAPLLHLPEWLAPVVLWIGVIAFPFVVMFSFIYELTPEGLKRESEVDRAASITHLTARRLDKLIIGLLLLAMGLYAFDRFAPRRDAIGPDRPAAATQVDHVPTAPVPQTALDDRSIAVLPFVNMSSDREQEYFSDGLSEELLNLLSQVPQLRVIARTSSFAFKEQNVSIPEIARQLNVAHVLEGSVRKSGDTLRITAQLVRASDSSHLWSESYDRKLTDVFKVQDEIARAVVEALKVKLLTPRLVVSPHRTANTEAYSQYLLGNQFFNRGNEADYHRAVTAYRQAIALDPDYAAAWAGLSLAESYLAGYTETAAIGAAAMQRALTAADKAIALAPDLADGYVARGTLRATHTWDWSGAQADLERARTLDPGSSTAQLRYGQLLQSLGRLPEAIAVTRKAVELDPLSVWAWRNLGKYLIYTGRLPEAREALDRALAISPDSSLANLNLGMVELKMGRPQEALTRFRRAGESYSEAGVAMAEHTLGHARESQLALDELVAKYTHDSAYQIAWVHAWRGENDRALDWLERAYAQRDAGLVNIKTDPILDSLRAEPRFLALVRKLGLPE